MENQERALRKEAAERVAFKKHLFTYTIIVLFSWAIWYFTSAINGYYAGLWPIWVTIGWGFGVLMHYWGVYRNDSPAIEKEYEKLKQERGL